MEKNTAQIITTIGLKILKTAEEITAILGLNHNTYINSLFFPLRNSFFT